MILKASAYINELQCKMGEKIFQNVKEKNEEKLYLDEEIEYLVNIELKKLHEENKSLK